MPEFADLGSLAGNAAERGELTRAEALYSETLVLTRELGGAARVAWTLLDLASMSTIQGAFDCSEEFLGESPR